MKRMSSIKALLEAVATANGYTVDQMKSKDKRTGLALTRKYYYYLAFVKYKFKCKRVGDEIERDHTTVLFGARSCKDMIDVKDPSILQIMQFTDPQLRITHKAKVPKPKNMNKIKLKLKYDELSAIYGDLFNNVGVANLDYFSVLHKATLIELYTKIAPKTMFRRDGFITLSITVAQAAALVMHIQLAERNAANYLDNVYLRIAAEIDKQIKK